MDVYQEAVQYLESKQVSESVADALEEDAFQEESVPNFFSAERLDLSDTPTCSPEEMLQKRLVLLKSLLDSEEVYLAELDTLLMPMKALRASAGTSQPVLTSHQIQTVFYQVPELREAHMSFFMSLKDRLQESELGDKAGRGLFDLEVGDLFLKMVNHIGLYGGFIENYEKAIEVVRKCTHSDPRFRTLAESMMASNRADNTRTKYTFEALLYKPLDRVTKTTLVMGDLLKTTPVEHPDHPAFMEMLRLSRSFLSGVNESSQSRREVTLSHGVRRQLMRDGFVVDTSEGQGSLRHLFLYTDLLLCTRFKHIGRGKPDQYRFSWYIPLAGLRLRWVAMQEHPPDISIRLHTIRTKMFLLWQQLQQGRGSKGLMFMARSRKKLEELELMLLTLSPLYRLELSSSSGKRHTLLFSSLYELEEWRESICKLTSDNIETVPPDLLTLTGSCVKLRMTQQPPLSSSSSERAEDSLCGTLSVALHSTSSLEQPAAVYVCAEVDGFEFYDRQAQTHSSVHGLNPHWDQELSFLVDSARSVKLLCVSQQEGREDAVLGKTIVKLDAKALTERWRRQTLPLGQVDLTFSLKYSPHPLEVPSSTAQQLPIFGVSLEKVAQQEGVLVPHVVRCCVEEVERRGMQEVGIYRVSGASGEINELKAAFNSNLREAVSRLRSAEVNIVSGVLKLYFRELPEPLLPAELFQSLAQNLNIPDVDSQQASMLSSLRSCSTANQHTFLYLLHHLRRVAQMEAVNRMSLLNLATVFGPSLLRPPVAGQSGPSMDISQEVVIQVQGVFCYLQCDNLPEAQTSLPHDEDAEDETTYL